MKVTGMIKEFGGVGGGGLKFSIPEFLGCLDLSRDFVRSSKQSEGYCSSVHIYRLHKY